MWTSNDRCKENLPMATTSRWIQCVCHPELISHAPNYHPNLPLKCYAPPTKLLWTQLCHIVQHHNTSGHFFLITKHTTTSYRFPTPPLLTSPLDCHTMTCSLLLILYLHKSAIITCQLHSNTLIFRIFLDRTYKLLSVRGRDILTENLDGRFIQFR
jgi:hypothetical protein